MEMGISMQRWSICELPYVHYLRMQVKRIKGRKLEKLSELTLAKAEIPIQSCFRILKIARKATGRLILLSKIINFGFKIDKK